MSDLKLFVGKALVIFGGLATIAAFHSVVVALHHGCKFQAHSPALVNVLGLFMTTFFISITTVTLSPFHYSSHPNGVDTVYSHVTVILGSREHAWMLAVAAITLSLP